MVDSLITLASISEKTQSYHISMQFRLAMLWCHARKISSNSCARIAESMSHSQVSNGLVDAACACWLAVDGAWVSWTASCASSCSGNIKSSCSSCTLCTSTPSSKSEAGIASCDGVGSTVTLTAVDVLLDLLCAKCATSSSVQYGLVVPHHVRRLQMSRTALLVILYLCPRLEASRSRFLRFCCLATKMMMASAGEMVQTPAV